MLTTIMRVCIAALLLSGLFISDRPVAAATQPTYYLSLGDSVGLGVGTSGPGVSYADRLTAFLQGPYTGAFSFGLQLARSGETTGSMISGGQLSAALAQINNPDNDAAVVTLTIGGDDLLQLLQPGQPCSDPSSPACPAAIEDALTTFAANYAQILGTLNAALASDGGETRLLTLTYYNPFSGTGSEYEAAMDAILLGSDRQIDCAPTEENPFFPALGLNDLITCIGQAHGARVVDVHPLFVGKGPQLTHINALDIHPNDRGYDVITGALLTRLSFVFLPAAGV
jgi:lysophospholipase L1-like esterase